MPASNFYIFYITNPLSFAVRNICSLYYCNGVFAGLLAGLFNRLKSVIRAAARVVLGLPDRAPVMSAICHTLHRRSYPQRVTFGNLEMPARSGTSLPHQVLHTAVRRRM